MDCTSFATPDTLADPGRDWLPSHPQSWNSYAYVRNNPINFIDPDGQLSITITVTARAPSDSEIWYDFWDNALWFGGQLSTGFGALDVSTARQYYLNAAHTQMVEGNHLNAAMLEILGTELVPDTQGGLWATMGMILIPGTLDEAVYAGVQTGKLTGFTRHGLHQAISRDGVGVATRAILNTLKEPLKITQQSNGTIKYVGEHAVVILNKAGKVVTTWARDSSAWRIAR